MIHFKAKEAEAIAILEAYCNNLSAVADHSNMLGEVNDWVVKVSEARDAIATLHDILGPAESDTTPGPTNSAQEG